MSKIVAQIKRQERVKSLIGDANLHTLPIREQSMWGEHGHGHEEALDPHVWLSTDNAILIVSAFTEWISRIDADNRRLYQSNRDEVIARIHQTREQMSKILESVKTVPYIVFHDAWQYYENENQLNAQTSISRSTNHAPVIRQLQDLNRLIRERDIRCVFREPQFESRIIPTVIEGTRARVAALDPVGAELTPGPDMWHELMLSIATSLKTCLAGEQPESGIVTDSG